MSTTATLTATMADLKPPAHSSLWSGYGGSTVPLSSTRYDPISMESPGIAAQHSSSTTPSHPHPHHHQPHHALDRRSSHPAPSVDHHPAPYSAYPRHYSLDESAAFDRHPHQSLTQHHSHPSLKRPYEQHEQPPYHEMVQDLRDDGSKLTVNHDHKLLSFRRVQDKHTIVDQHGRMQQLELSAQLHGMFFLSEMPTNTSDGAMMQPELTCYRRNLFQISGSLITPRGQLSVVSGETGETVPVTNTEVTISAIESVDGHPVRLIVIPWKTPPPNSPEMPQTPDQEPPSLPLIPFQDDTSDADGEYAVYPIGWRRLQFRIATANNGRRKELQQHFVLHLRVLATLANGSKAVLTEATTAPIVVRGRSPRNFQARKEIPLLGSSAGSRGQALVETGLGVVAGPLAIKPESKLRGLNLELPRTAFTFNASKLPGSPMTMRSNSYPSWNTPGPGQLLSSQLPSAPTSYPPSTMAADSYQKVPLSSASSYASQPQEMPSVQLSLVGNEQPPAMRAPYGYVPSSSAPPHMPISATTVGSGSDHNLSVPRSYVDNDPRPAKRQSIHSTGSISNSDASEYRYGPSYVPVNSSNPNDMAPSPYSAGGEGGSTAHHAGQPPPPPRDYYSSNSWATSAGEPNASVGQAYSSAESRPYAFPDQYKTMPPMKTEHSQAQGPYGNSLTHYSWNTT